MKSNKSIPLMLITPDMSGGSYLSSVYPIQLAGLSASTVVVTLSKVAGRTSNLKVFGFSKYLDYRKIGQLMAKNPIVSLMYHSPLYLMTLVLFLRFKPSVIISNGLLSGLFGLFLASIFRREFVLSHNGQLEFYVPAELLRTAERILAPTIGYAVANSTGSKEDLSKVIPKEKILVVEPPVEKSFFEVRDRQHLRNEMGIEKKFVILYAGWLNREKRCDKLLGLVPLLRGHEKIIFWFAGDGELRKEILVLSKEMDNVKFFGYVQKVDALADLFTAADMVWGIADTTYLARTAVEALACGTPIIIPNVPGVAEKAERGMKIPPDMIPPEIGFIIDDTDIDAEKELILHLASGALARNSQACREYAIAHNSSDDYVKLIQRLIKAVVK